MRILKKSFIFTMIFVFSFTVLFTSTTKSAEAAGRVWVDLGSGHKAGFDGPHDPKTGKWHVHIYKGSKQVASENLDGSKHDGSTLKKAPSAVVKKLKKTAEYKKYKKKQTKLTNARKNVKKYSWAKLLFDPTPIIVLAGAIGLSFYGYSLAKWKIIIG